MGQGWGGLEEDKPSQRYTPHPRHALSPPQDQARAEGSREPFKRNSLSVTGRAQSTPLSAPRGARGCSAHKRPKAARGPSQLVLIFAFGKAN